MPDTTYLSPRHLELIAEGIAASPLWRSLAAAALLDLGVTDATDLAGGYRAWAAAVDRAVTGS